MTVNKQSEKKVQTLAIVLPCYNEEQILSQSKEKLASLLDSLHKDGLVGESSFVLFVDDGSTDHTWHIIETIHAADARFAGLKLAGNAGHQNAIMAGMLAVKDLADCAITLDVDLQDDIAVIPEMLRRFLADDHIVYGVRRDRTSDTWFKRNTAKVFYNILSLLGVKMIPGHSDFRLVSQFVLQELAGYNEQNLFLRTVFPAMNVRSSCLYYARLKRTLGETKYTFQKMIGFALRGIVVSTPVPLRLAGILSIFTFLLAIIQSFLALYAYIQGNVIPGWTSLILAILYLGAIQLFCLAIMGEYIARVFTEVKNRPRFLVEKILK